MSALKPIFLQMGRNANEKECDIGIADVCRIHKYFKQLIMNTSSTSTSSLRFKRDVLIGIRVEKNDFLKIQERLQLYPRGLQARLEFDELPSYRNLIQHIDHELRMKRMRGK